MVVIVSGPPIRIERGRDAMAPALSATRIVKLAVSETVGVPEIAPVLEFRLSPVGRFPEETDQLSGEVPPAARTCCV